MSLWGQISWLPRNPRPLHFRFYPWKGLQRSDVLTGDQTGRESDAVLCDFFSRKIPKLFFVPSRLWVDQTQQGDTDHAVLSVLGLDHSFPDPGQPMIPTEPAVLKGLSCSFAKQPLMWDNVSRQPWVFKWMEREWKENEGCSSDNGLS